MTWTLAAKTGLLLTGALAVAVIAPAAPAAGAVGAAEDSSLRLAGVRFGAATQLVVAVPPDLARQALPDSAFHVIQDGRGLPLSVQRVTDGGLDVYVVLDTAVPRPTLAAEQSAAVELLRNLPPSVRTAAVGSAGSAVPAAQPGNATALRDLSVITPQATASPTPALTAIAALPADGRRRAIVLLTDCHAAAAAHLQPLAASLGRGDRDQQLDVVAPGSGCPQDLPSLATRAGGLAVVGQSLARVDQALDTVLLDLLGQYRVTLPASARGKSLTVTVDQAGARASTDIVAAALPRSAAAAARPTHKAGGTSRGLLAALVVLVVVLAIVAGAIAVRRRRAPAGAPVSHAAARPAREAAGPPPFRPVVQAADKPPPERPPDKPAGWSPAALPGFVSTGVTDQTVRVRLPELADASALQAYAGQADGMADGWVPVPADDAGPAWTALVDAWLQTWRAGPGGGALSLLVERCADRRVVGYVGLRMGPRAADISFGTAPPWRSNGYATRSLRLIADWLTDDDPARTVQAMIRPEDDASCNVARQAGFQPTGVTRTFVPETGRVELDLRYVFRPGAAGEAQ